MCMRRRDSSLYSLAKGVLWSVIATLVGVLLLALVVWLASPGKPVITAVTQVIKVISIFFGVRIALRNVSKRGWIYGIVLGILYTALTFFVFSIIGSDFEITTGILVEMAFCVAIAVISALLIRVGRGRAA